MPLSTRFTEMFGIRHPICLAAMDLVADAALTSAVSDAGGLGLLGAGYGDDAWLERELDRLSTMRGAHARPFGIGYITWSLQNRPHVFARALAARPSAIWLSFGDPQPFIDPIHAIGAKVICQVQTVGMARDAVEKGADVIVAQGGEAGGHGVSRGTLALVPAVVDAVGARVPVLAAGGIADGRGLAAALMLGADGVVLGTRFYATPEAYGHPKAKQVLCSAGGDDTARSIVFDISRRNVWPAPFNGRCVVNAHLKRWLGREIELLRQIDSESPHYQAARDAGDFDVAAVIAGESLDMVHDLVPAREVVENIARDAEALLARASTRIL